MRLILLLLISMCVFSADVEPRLPATKDLPGWAKQLSVKWENAWGKTAAWRKLDGQSQPGAKMRRESEEEYSKLFESAFTPWAKSVKLTKIPATADGASWYNGSIDSLVIDKKSAVKHDIRQWLRNDDFFIKYATLHNDPLALAFLFVPVNRQHYSATTPQ